MMQRTRQRGWLIAILGLGGWQLAAAATPAGAQQVVDLPAGDRALEADLRDVYRVGTIEGADWEIFGELSQVAFDGEGTLFIFDRGNSRVVVVGPDGSFLREFGRAGEGPGEWRMPVGMAVLRDGRVVVSDMGHRALLVYDAEGGFSHSVPLDVQDGGLALGALHPDPRGETVYSGGGGIRVMVRTGSGAAEATSGRAIEQIGLGREGLRSEFYRAWEAPRDDSPTTLSAGSARFSVAGGGPRSFEPALRVGVLPDGGLAVVDSSAWAVKVVGPEGDLRRVLRRPSVGPRAVTERVQERERERRLAELEAGEGPRMSIRTSRGDGAVQSVPQEQVREMQRSQIEQMRFYHEIPALSGLGITWNGTLWLERTPDDWWEDGPVDLVSADGRYLGTLPASGPGIPAAFGPDGLAAWVERDEFDVPTVVVRRLPEALR